LNYFRYKVSLFEAIEDRVRLLRSEISQVKVRVSFVTQESVKALDMRDFVVVVIDLPDAYSSKLIQYLLP
jgi:hypothetical protein